MCLPEPCGSSWGSGSCPLPLTEAFVSPGRKANSEESTKKTGPYSRQILCHSSLHENKDNFVLYLPCVLKESWLEVLGCLFLQNSAAYLLGLQTPGGYLTLAQLSYIQYLDVAAVPLLSFLSYFRKGNRSDCQVCSNSGVTV